MLEGKTVLIRTPNGRVIGTDAGEVCVRYARLGLHGWSLVKEKPKKKEEAD